MIHPLFNRRRYDTLCFKFGFWLCPCTGKKRWTASVCYRLPLQANILQLLFFLFLFVFVVFCFVFFFLMACCFQSNQAFADVVDFGIRYHILPYFCLVHRNDIFVMISDFPPLLANLQNIAQKFVYQFIRVLLWFSGFAPDFYAMSWREPL